MRVRTYALGGALLAAAGMLTSNAAVAGPGGSVANIAGLAERGPLLSPVHWRKRAPVYPHYPRDYWWYYRPYDYGRYNHYPRGRSLTYFHYLYEPEPRRSYRHRDHGPGYK